MCKVPFLYFFVVIMSMLVGLGIGFFMLYVGKFKTYIEEKSNNENKFFKAIDIIWRVTLPFIFLLFFLIIPGQIIYLWINVLCEMKISRFITIYLFCFIFIFILVMIVLIKTGKIKKS
jgi:hypothetical protein